MHKIPWLVGLLLLYLIPLPGLDFLHKSSFALEPVIQLRGKVIDAESRSPIGYANVSLFLLTDTVPLKITATDSKGDFIFSNLQAGSYFVQVNFIGFKNFTTQLFVLKWKESVFRLEPIAIQFGTLDLDEIDVIANADNPVYQIDKKTIYVENQLTGTGGNASDLLLKLPSITQNPDGQIAIHGNPNVLVYINGKPSSLKGEELLHNTSAAQIRKIELITSPSAKYAASGSGGIINLVTKKSNLSGFNGNILAAVDDLGGYSTDLLLNYKFGRFNIFAGIDHNRRRNKGGIDYITDYLTDLTRFTKSGEMNAQRINTGFRAGIDYQPTSSDNITVSGNGGNFETTNDGTWNTTTIQLNSPLTTSTPNSATDANKRYGSYGGADFTYEHKFDAENKILSISSLWNTVDYDDQYLNLAYNPKGLEQIRQLTQISKTNYNFQFNADYNTPTGKFGNLEIGYQFTLNKEHEVYLSELSNPPPPEVTGEETHYNGVVQAGYGTWQFKVRRLNLKAGIRAENLNRELNTTNNSYVLNRFDLYPSLNSTFKVDSIQEIQFNYSRRTDQLRTAQLDPIPRWYDFYNVVTGNPNLRNELTDKVALNYLLSFPRLTFNSELYFYNTVDKIELISSLYKNGIIQNRYENMGNEKTLGVEFNANWKTRRWFSLNEKLGIIDSWLFVNINQISQQRNYHQLYSIITANFSITPTTLFELNFTYYGPSLTAQSHVSQVFLGGLSFRQLLFNNKISFTLTGRDVLGLYRKVEHIQGTDFNQEITTCNNFPIRFSLSYKFNQFKRNDRQNAKIPVLE